MIGGAAVLFAALLGTASSYAQGAAESAPTSAVQQVPGYYHQRIGSMQVTALFDGAVALGRRQIRGLSPAKMNALLQDRHVPETAAGLQTAVNAFLIQKEGRRVLVDAGASSCLGEGLGQVMRNLQAAGYSPQQVDDVLVTHARPDHLCGIVDGAGRPAFPKATLWVAADELAYWHSALAERQTPAALTFIVAQTRAALAAYEATGQLKIYRAGERLPAGARALPTPGHTPGHRSFVFEDASAGLLVWGDVLHYHAVQFARPSASFEWGVDRDAAIASRRQMLALAQQRGWWVGGAHLPFPGLGHVRRERDAYAWVPAEFSPLAPPH